MSEALSDRAKWDSLSRAEKVILVRWWVARGLTHRSIAGRYGLGKSTVRNLLYDPDGSKQSARRERYRASCPLCGTKMDGSNGRKKTPRYCLGCSITLQRKPLTHGTRSGYTKGCRCEDCLGANAQQARKTYRRRRREGTWKPGRQSPEQTRAYYLVSKAIMRGDLIPADRCESCGKPDRRGADGRRRIQAHHEDYSRPLDVQWLCPPCHKARDKTLRQRLALVA